MKQMIIKLDLESPTFEEYTTWEIESILKRFYKDLRKEDEMKRWEGLCFIRDEKGNIVGEVYVQGYGEEEKEE